MSCRLSVIQHPTAHCGLSDASPPSHFFGGLLLQQLAICWFWHPAVAGTEPWPSRRRRPEAMGWEDNGGHLNAAELRVPLLRINLQGLVLLRPQAGREISPNVTQQPILHLRPPTSPKAYILHPGIQTLPACTIWQSSTSNPGGTSTLVSLTWAAVTFSVRPVLKIRDSGIACAGGPFARRSPKFLWNQ